MNTKELQVRSTFVPGKYRITGVTLAAGIFPAMDAPETNDQCLNADFLFTS